MSRTVASLCVAGLTSLALITPTAAHAAPDGARGEANALRATILGQPGDTGTVVATNDGTGQDKNSDAVNPPITVLTGQPYAGIGVLAQDAVATDDGDSAACAGVAGDGGTANVIEIGDSNCITPGENLDLQLANLDLSVLLEAEVVEGTGSLGDVLGGIPQLGDGLAQIIAALQAGVDELEGQLGNAGLVVNAGAIESSCDYEDGEADGTTFLTNVGIDVVIPQVGRQTLLELPTEPEPGTRVVTELDAVTGLLLTQLAAGLNENLDELTGPVADLLTGTVQEDIVEAAVAQLQPLLQVVEAQLLTVILNEQSEGDDGSIAVTGLSAEVLPGLAEFGGPTVLDVNIANVGCGPFAGAGAPGAPGTTDTEGNPVPTIVNAGEGTNQWIQGGLLGGLALLVAGGTVVGLRRARS